MCCQFSVGKLTVCRKLWFSLSIYIFVLEVKLLSLQDLYTEVLFSTRSVY